MNFEEDLLKCSICRELLQTPVVLPCGHNICKHHQNEDTNRKDGIMCNFCHTTHVIPESGFFPNTLVEKLIEMQLDEIDMGDEYKNASDSIRELEEITEELQEVVDNPENEIYEKISAFKNQIDLDREVLKKKIDEEADLLIKELEEFERECKSNIAVLSEKFQFGSKVTSLFDTQNQLESWKAQLNSFVKKTAEWIEIKEKCGSIVEKLEIELETLRNELFLGKLDEFKKNNVFHRSFGLRRFEFVVKNVSQYTSKQEKTIDLWSDKESFCNIGWGFCVEIDQNQSISIYFGNEKQNDFYIEWECDLCILNINNPLKSIYYNVKKNKSDDLYYGQTSIIRLGSDETIYLGKELIYDCELYDRENDCFTVQAVLKNFKKSIL